MTGLHSFTFLRNRRFTSLPLLTVKSLCACYPMIIPFSSSTARNKWSNNCGSRRQTLIKLDVFHETRSFRETRDFIGHMKGAAECNGGRGWGMGDRLKRERDGGWKKSLIFRNYFIIKASQFHSVGVIMTVINISIFLMRMLRPRVWGSPLLFSPPEDS